MYLLSGYGENADWVRNLLVRPEVRVQMPRTICSVSQKRTYLADLGPVDDQLGILSASVRARAGSGRYITQLARLPRGSRTRSWSVPPGSQPKKAPHGVVVPWLSSPS